MKQPLQKFEFATSILRFAKDHDIPTETVKEAIELLHRDICGTPSTVAAVNEDVKVNLPNSATTIELILKELELYQKRKLAIGK